MPGNFTSLSSLLILEAGGSGLGGRGLVEDDLGLPSLATIFGLGWESWVGTLGGEVGDSCSELCWSGSTIINSRDVASGWRGGGV